MFKAIVIVFLGIVLLAYGSLFFAWNLTPQEITSWQLGARYSQVLPVGSLAFIGLVLGALIMAVATASTYASQRATTRKAAATIRKAKAKLQAQLDAINELRGEVERLEGELAGLRAGDGTWGKASYAPEAATESTTAAAATEDDDII